MSRPSQIEEKRKELLPIVAQAFSELGYRRATIAEIAYRCDVQENILYRLWQDKKAIFIAAIHHVYDSTIQVWTEQASRKSHSFSITDVLEYESDHLGEFGHYRILFTALGETDDQEIGEALTKAYRGFYNFIRDKLEEQSEKSPGSGSGDPAIAAWALMGLGTISTIGRELELMSPRVRKRLLKEGGKWLVGGVE